MASLKGGVGKTTSAIHLAALLNQKAKTVLIDSDKNESALTWARKGKLSFPVCPLESATKFIREAVHVVIDTAARPTPADLEAIATGCDLLVLPTTPKALDLDALLRTADILTELNAQFKVLLTITPPRRKKRGSQEIELSLKERQARDLLAQAEIPTFSATIYEYTVFERTPLAGVTVDEYPDKYGKLAWQCYASVIEEIFNEQQ